MSDPIIDRFAMAVAANRSAFDELWPHPGRLRGWLGDVLSSSPSHREHLWFLATTSVAVDIQRLSDAQLRPNSSTFRAWTSHLERAGLSAQDAAWAVRAWLTALGSGAGSGADGGQLLPLFLVLLLPEIKLGSLREIVQDLERRSQHQLGAGSERLLVGAVALRAHGTIRVVRSLAEEQPRLVSDDGATGVGRVYDVARRARQIADELDDQMRSVRAEGGRPAQPHVLVIYPDAHPTLSAVNIAVEWSLAGLLEQPSVSALRLERLPTHEDLVDHVWIDRLEALVRELEAAPTLAPQAVQMSELIDIVAGDLGDGRSVLPLYLCCDVSASMSRHGRLEALNAMLEQLRDAIVVDPDVADKVRFSVLDFSEDSRVVLPLCELDSFVTMPVLTHRTETSYIAAFESLLSSMVTDIPELAKVGYAVHRPAVFFLSDGAPSDPEWHWKKALRKLETHEYRPQMISFGVGEADPRALARIGKVGCYMTERPEDAAAAIREFGELLIQSFLASGTTGRLVVPNSTLQHLKRAELLESY